MKKRNIFLLLLTTFSLVFCTEKKSFKNLSSRKLADTATKQCKICSKTSEEYAEYYKSGDTTKINMDEDNTEKYNSYYIKALINIVGNYYEKKRAEKNNASFNPNSNYKKDLFKYAYHILPLLIILGLGILSLFVWIVWAVCICKKCKCCYCNRPKCKTPSIVLALIFYIIVSLISIYALIEQDKIFTGLADLECSVIKFTDEVLQGEKNPYPPFWSGISKIQKSLMDISAKIDELKLNTLSVLETLQTGPNGIDSKKSAFENSLKDAGNNMNGAFSNDGYQLDLANKFGTFVPGNPPTLTDDTVCYYWYKEYSKLYTDANDEMNKIKDDYLNVILTDTDSKITNSLTNANTALDSIKTEFETLEYLLSDYIKENADSIDKKGKIIYALFFSLLVIFSVAITVLMLLLCCCSGKVCTNLTCFQCFFKYFLHVFWNVMALIMFLLFMGGSLFTMAGRVGEDLVGAISFIISKDNLDADKNTIILGNVKNYLNKCFNGDGNILTELGFETEMGKFKQLKESKLKMEDFIDQFKDKTKKFVYNEYLEEYNDRINYNTLDLKLIGSSSSDIISFSDLLTQLNTYATDNNKYENWFTTSTSQDTCNSNHDGTQINYHPFYCFPLDSSWVQAETDSAVSNIKNDLYKIKTVLDNTASRAALTSSLDSLNTAYTAFLDTEVANLQKYADKMKEFTNIVETYTSEDGEYFSYMNCNFLKTNAEVVLFYLKNRFGNDFFEVGVYLLIAAFSMPFAISFTILLIVISNEEIEKNKEDIIKLEERKNKKDNLLHNIKKEEISSVKNGNMTEKEHLNDKMKQM